jgi:hypothetical protein
MAADSAISVIIAAEFVGKPAFKSAETSTEKLNKSVKSLAKSLGLAFSVGAVLAFAKASVRAAAEDEKAQKQLALALKNVGLGRDIASSEEYISRLQTEFGILDNDLRPAYQSLAIATRSSSEAQNLLGIALDVASANSLDVVAVSKALSKAYLGNNTALAKLGIGISKTDLATKSFDEIMNDLAKTFKGAAAQSADTFAGKMARLTVSIENAKEILGKGLIDSFMILTDSNGIEDLQVKIENFATAAANSMRKLATVFKENETLIKSIAAVLAATFITTKLIAGVAATVTAINTLNKAYKVLRATAIGAAIAQATILTPFGAAVAAAALLLLIDQTIRGVDALTDAYNRANDAKDAALNPDRYNNPATQFEKGFGALDKYTKKVTIITKQTKEQLAAAKLKLAIDKANLALGKGSDVFDMEKIQLAAAEKNQAEQLGKITSQAQLLQITNDLARLKVKQSMLALEEAIASKDVASITAATNKLNADLGVLGALNGQSLKLTEIKGILDAILPKDLINLANLNEAIRLLGLIGGGTGGTVTKNATPILGDPNVSPSGIPIVLTPDAINKILENGGFVPIVPDSSGGIGYSGNGNNYASSGFPGSDKGFNGGGGNITVTIVDKTSGLIQVVQDAVIENNRYGNNLNYAGAIA